MTKKIFTLILALCVTLFVGALCVSGAEVATGIYGDNVIWVLDEEGTLTFRGNGKVCHTNGSSLPDENLVVKKIVFEDGITGIEEHTFGGMYNLQSVIMSDSITEVGYSAFRWCSSLTNITFSKNLKTIPPFVFANCTSLTTVDIPESVVCIDDGAFSGCTNLESVSMPDSVKYIVGRTFSDCTKLENINLPKKIKIIDFNAFYNTAFYNNESNWDNSSLYYGNILLAIDEEYTGNYVVDDDIEYIALSAFDSYNYSMTGRIIISENNKKYSSDTDVYLYNKNKNTVYECFADWEDENIIVPQGVDTIGAYSFKNMFASNITLPNGIITIEDGAFYGCNMHTINIPAGVTYIGSNAFNRCYNMESIIIPESVEYIGTDAFFWCGGSYESDFTIFGTTGSYAETYAKENNITFESISKHPFNIDGNEEINNDDVISLAEIILCELTPEMKELADVNGDNKVDIKDLIYLAQKVFEINK